MAVRKYLSTVSFAALFASALLAAGVVVVSNSETVVRQSFSVALGGAPAVAPVRIAKSVPVAGSEEFWLTTMGLEGSLPVTKAVAIGDRIGLTVRGENRELEVSSVSEFAPAVTEIDTRTRAGRFILVTARDLADKGAKPVRFVMEVEQGLPAVAAQTARAL